MLDGKRDKMTELASIIQRASSSLDTTATNTPPSGGKSAFSATPTMAESGRATNGAPKQGDGNNGSGVDAPSSSERPNGAHLLTVIRNMMAKQEGTN